MSFIESPRFPDNISYGSSGGPKFNNTIIVVDSGAEYSNINWDFARHYYDVAMGIRDQAELTQLIKFFHVTRGRGHYFRFKDWKDYSVTAEVFGTGDTTETIFQLIKTYDIGGGTVNIRNIYKPVSGTVTIYIDGSPETNLTIDYTTGLVTFDTAPTTGAVLTWTGDFDVPCRFDTDTLSVSYDFYQYGSASIPIIEVRP